MILNQHFLSSICWVCSWYLRKLWWLTSWCFVSNLNRICVCWVALTFGSQKWKNVWHLNQSFDWTQFTYIWNRERLKALSCEFLNMASNKCTQFYNQYNIVSCFSVSFCFACSSLFSLWFCVDRLALTFCFNCGV